MHSIFKLTQSRIFFPKSIILRRAFKNRACHWTDLSLVFLWIFSTSGLCSHFQFYIAVALYIPFVNKIDTICQLMTSQPLHRWFWPQGEKGTRKQNVAPIKLFPMRRSCAKYWPWPMKLPSLLLVFMSSWCLAEPQFCSWDACDGLSLCFGQDPGFFLQTRICQTRSTPGYTWQHISVIFIKNQQEDLKEQNINNISVCRKIWLL